MVDASTSFVHMEELMFAACDRIAELMMSEWALVSCGCAAALVSITAACMAGSDPAAMVQLPDTTGLRNEVMLCAESAIREVLRGGGRGGGILHNHCCHRGVALHKFARFL